MSTPWTREEADASGQVFEFRLWAALTEQSRGQLHVFLPLSDRGIDALVHRLSDGVYIPVQAKGRSKLARGYVHLFVLAESVTDDSVFVVGGLIVEAGLGPALLVIPASDFRRLAELTVVKGRPRYSMAFGMDLHSKSRWLPWLVPLDRLGEKFGVSPGLSIPALIEEAPPFASGDLGFLGESEVVRRLAEAKDLNLFRAFPDSETAEVVVRNRTTRQVIGLQIKTVSVDAAHQMPSVDVAISSFRPSPTTYFTVLAWMRKERRFHEECLVFPSQSLRDFARQGDKHFVFNFHPGSLNQGRLDAYRHALGELSSAIGPLLAVK